MRVLAGWFHVGLCAVFLGFPAIAADGQPTLWIKGKRVILRPGEEIHDAAILVRGGKITAVGTDLLRPEDAKQIEGEVVCAAYVDAWGALGLGMDSLQDPGTTAATRTVDGLDPWADDHLRRETLRAGVTVVRVQAGNDSRVGGVGVLVRVAPDLPAGEAVIVADCSLSMTIGKDASGGGERGNSDPFDRIADLDRVVSAVESGKNYLISRTEHRYELEEWEKKISEKEAELEKDLKKAKKEREKEQKDAEEKGKPFQEKKYKEDKRPQPPRYDEDSEVLARVADGGVPLFVQTNRSAEIRGLLAGTADYDRLRMVLAGGAEALTCAHDLAERRVPVLVSPVPRGRFGSDEHEQAALSLAGDLARAGVSVLLGTGGSNPAASRDLPLLAALAIGNGLDRAKAFEAITLGAARAFDASDRIGSLEVGKDAEILVLDGEPLSSGSQVRYVVSGGRVVVEPGELIMMLSILALAVAVVPLGTPSAVLDSQSRPLAIRADRILLADGRTLTQGVILVEDGRIAAVGTDVDVPENALVVEHGGTASAGLIALHSYSGSPSEMIDSTRSVLSEARVAYAFDSTNADFSDALHSGITSLVLAPVPASLCSGASALVKTAGGTVVNAQSQLSLGFSARSLRNNRFPTSHGGAIAELDRLFESPEGAFARAAKNQIPVLFEVSSRDDVARAVAFAQRHELTGAISGAPWAGELADTIRSAELSVVCGPIRVGEERRDLLAVRALEKAGVPFGFALDAPGNHPVLLRAGVAMCLREGLGREAAWRALTSDAARIAGAADRIGDLAKGLDADIVLWSGDPLDLASSVEAVYVGGALAWEGKP